MKLHINEETGSIWLELNKLQAARLFDKTEIHTISCKSANLTRGDKIPSFEELETITPLLDVESFAIKLGEVVDLHRGLCDKSLEILNLLMPDVHKFRLRGDILNAPKTTLKDIKALDELKSKLSNAKEVDWSKRILAAKCEEERDTFLMFIAIPERKLQAVKSIKEILEIGLQEAKDIADKTSTDELPLSNTSYTRTKATNLQAQLHEQGVTVIIGTISTLDKLRIKTCHLRVHAVTNSMAANKFAEELRITLRLDRENAIQAYEAIMINNSYTLGTLYTKAQAIKKREALQRSGIVTTVIE